MTDEPRPEGYTIDELAAVSRVPSRTIRFYQSKGALKAPQIHGRVAYYGKEHLERLELIAQLQDRGLRMNAIRDLMARIDKGELDVSEWLGLEQQMQASWSNDAPRTVTEAELYELAGTQRRGLIADLTRTGLAERHGDTYLVRSPALLTIATKLETAGVDLHAAAEAGAMMRKAMGRLSADLAEHFFKHAAEFGAGAKDGDLASAMQSLRPLGTEALRIIFAQEMERTLRKLVETGRTAKLPARRKKL